MHQPETAIDDAPPHDIAAGRLFVVSNRVMLPGAPQAGGLAQALSNLLRCRGGTWMGWSGRLSSSGRPQRRVDGDVHYITWDLARSDFDDYYREYANRTLWPLLHGRTDLMAFRRSALQGYLRVNERFADLIAHEASDRDLVWVHDYHLIPLASMLRARGLACRIGFFLHTPLPAPRTLVALPGHRALFGRLAACDLVGLQTETDALALRGYLTLQPGAGAQYPGFEVPGAPLPRIAAFPVGTDPDAMQRVAAAAQDLDDIRELQHSLAGKELMIGVDRLDYSKGLPERLRAFGQLLGANPDLRERAVLLQIAPESRRDLREYQHLSREVQRLVGDINGHHAAPTWTPVRYVNRDYPHSVLAGFYRIARVAAVTPLNDGMNLVAKEYLACQSERDPGVLVLSEFAGAAAELGGCALTVNPYDIDGCAAAMARAFAMPLEERRNRWRTAFSLLRRGNVHRWCDDFLDALRQGRDHAIPPAPAPGAGNRRIAVLPA